MSAAQEERWVGIEDVPSIPTLADAEWVSSQEPVTPSAKPWSSETWATFRDTSQDEPRWLISGLLPEGQLVFTAAPPKKGKTWLAIAKALSLATGKSLFGEYAIPEPVQTLYVALEGSRPAMRARIGCICRGLGVDPDLDLPYLRMLYRPRPFDLAQLEYATWLEEEVYATGARYVVIDVLRAAARIKETDPGEFLAVRDRLEPLLREGVTVDLLHHFGKVTDTQKERTPGERMSGTGAMYGALDVGFYITRSESGARRLRIELEARDFATPDAIGVVIEGTGSGEHGGFRYADTATFRLDAGAAEERDLVSEIEELLSDGRWRTLGELASKKDGIGANKAELKTLLEEHPERFVQVVGPLVGRHVNATPWGTSAMHQGLDQGVGLDGLDTLFEGSANRLDQRVAPPTGETTRSHTLNQGLASGSAPRTTPADEDDGIPF